jgi:hypothetical protein
MPPVEDIGDLSYGGVGYSEDLHMRRRAKKVRPESHQDVIRLCTLSSFT